MKAQIILLIIVAAFVHVVDDGFERRWCNAIYTCEANENE